MFLIYRPVRLEDLPECLNCTRDYFAFDDVSRPQLLELWRELVSSGAANATVIQDVDRPPGQQFLHFCMIIHVSSDYADQLRRSSAGPIAHGILNDWLSGHRPWLSAAQVRKANSREGVHLITMNSGPRKEIIQSGEIQWVTTRITDYTPWAIAGYRLNEFVLEMYSPLEYAYAEEYGMQLCREQVWKGRANDEVCIRTYHLMREEALQRLGSAIAELFHYHLPRFGFSAGEQELLWCSMHRELDVELADFLNVAPITIKKRWLNIYERVSLIDPELLGPNAPEGKRGNEKKRRLLNYLQHHMEELRPVERPKIE